MSGLPAVRPPDGRVAAPAATSSRGPTVCYFGYYKPEYTRVRVIVNGLRDAGAEVIECRSAARWRLLRFPDLALRFLRTARHSDVILVNEAGHLYVPLAWLLGRVFRKPVVADVYLSKHLVMVGENRVVPPRSLRAWLYRMQDVWACRLADAVLLDTELHIAYFQRELNLAHVDFRPVPIGADEAYFSPRARPAALPAAERLRVLYVGTFNALQGIEHVVEAAALLRDVPGITFDCYGRGPRQPAAERQAAQLGLSNLTFHGWVAPERVPDLMSEADVCLGVFGSTTQAQMVVPCKVFEALAMRRPVVTGDTPAVRRMLQHGVHAVLCPPANARALADALLALRADPALRERIATGGHERFRAVATRAEVGARVRAICEDALREHRRG